MDDQQIAVCVCASSDADVGIIRKKDQIAGLGFAPRNIRAVDRDSAPSLYTVSS